MSIQLGRRVYQTKPTVTLASVLSGQASTGSTELDKALTSLAANAPTSASASASSTPSSTLTSQIQQVNQVRENTLQNGKVILADSLRPMDQSLRSNAGVPQQSTPPQSSVTTTTTYYDVDSSLSDVYNQAKSAGVTLNKPKSYGQTVTSQTAAQKIVDDYTNAANSALAKKAGVTSVSGGGSSASTVKNTAIYDISQNVKDVQAQAAKSGVSVSLPKTTSYSSQTEAQKALDSYVAATNSALSAKAQNEIAAVKSTSTAPTSTWNYQTEYNKLSSRAKKMLDDDNRERSAAGKGQANPAYYAWLADGTAFEANPPHNWSDQIKESAAQTQARNAANAAERAKVDAIQKKLQDDYAAVQKEAGTTHAKVAPVTNNGLSGSQLIAKNANVKQTVKATVVPAKTTTQAKTVTSTPAKTQQVTSKPVVSQKTTQELLKLNSIVKETQKATIVRPGQVQLANGQWIDQVQKTGSSNPNSGSVSVFTESVQEHHNNAVKATAQAKADYEAAKQAAGVLLTKKGELDNYSRAINQITDKNGNAKASLNALGQEVTISTPVVVNGKKTTYTRGGGETAKTASDYNTPILNGIAAMTPGYVSAVNPAKAKFDDIKAFKTVDQIRQENLIARGGVGGWLVQQDQNFRNAFSYKNVTNKVSGALDKADAATSPYVPTVEQVAQARATALDTFGKGTAAKLDNIIANNDKLRAVSEWEMGGYDYVKAHPARTAVQVGEIYATSVVGGAVLKGASMVAGAAATKALAPIVAHSSTIAKIAPTVSKVASAAPGVAAGGQMVNAILVDTKGLTDIKKDLDYAVMLAVGAKGFVKGARAMETGNPMNALPGVRSVDLMEVAPGASGNTRSLHQGTQLGIAGKSLISSDYKTGLHLGQVEVDARTLAPYIDVNKINAGMTGSQVKTVRQVQPFDAAAKKALNKYVETSDIISDVDKVYYAAGQKVTSSAYGAKQAIINPKTFSILSTDVPVELRATLTESIKSYGKRSGVKSTVSRLRGGTDYKIQVAGSNAQKLQMGDYLTRNPGDLEIYTDNPVKFTDTFIKTAIKNGFKEGTDFKIENKGTNEPKIAFKVNGKWEKGVEIFNHNSKSAAPDTMDIMNEYKQGWKKQEGIAYNFKELSSIKVENVKMQRLQEQAARKYAGATYIKGGDTVDIAHPGRVKDPRDLIEIGTANKVVHNVGKAQDVIDYAKAAVKKYPELIDKTNSKSYSPIAEYITKYGKLPDEQEILKLAKRSKVLNEKEILYEASSKRLPDSLREIVDKTKELEKASSLSSRTSVTHSARSLSSRSTSTRSSTRSSPSSKSSTSRSSASTRASSAKSTSSAKSQSSRSPSIKSTQSVRSPLHDIVKYISVLSKVPRSSRAMSVSTATLEQKPSHINATKARGSLATPSSRRITSSPKLAKSNPSPRSPPSVTSPHMKKAESPKSPRSQSSPKSPRISTTLSQKSYSTTTYSGQSARGANGGKESTTVFFGRKQRGEEKLLEKKKKKQIIEVKNDKDMAKVKRLIVNKLGGLESMLGDTVPTRTVRKTRRTARA